MVKEIVTGIMIVQEPTTVELIIVTDSIERNPLMEMMIVVWDHINVILVITAVAIEEATNAAMVKEIVIMTVIVLAVLLVETIIVKDCTMIIQLGIHLMTVVCSGTILVRKPQILCNTWTTPSRIKIKMLLNITNVQIIKSEFL
jgi:hypothetical protein